MYNGALSDMGLAGDPFTGGRYTFGGGNPISNVELDGHCWLPQAVCNVGNGIVDVTVNDFIDPVRNLVSNTLVAGAGMACPSMAGPTGAGGCIQAAQQDIPAQVEQKTQIHAPLGGDPNSRGYRAGEFIGRWILPLALGLPGLDTELVTIARDAVQAAIREAAAEARQAALCAARAAAARAATAAGDDLAASAAEGAGTSVFRTPRLGLRDAELGSGLNPANHLEGDQSAYLGTENVARDFANPKVGGYENGYVRYHMAPEFETEFSRYKFPYVTTSGATEAEWQIPANMISRFNELTLNRTWIPW